MPTRSDAVSVRAARRTRMPSSVLRLLAALAFVAASITGVFTGHAAASAAPSETHSVSAEKFAAHQPAKTRVSVGGDRSDVPQHRAAPWTPLAVTPDEPRLVEPTSPVEVVVASATPWQSYDLTTPQGRAPPR